MPSGPTAGLSSVETGIREGGGSWSMELPPRLVVTRQLHRGPWEPRRCPTQLLRQRRLGGLWGGADAPGKLQASREERRAQLTAQVTAEHHRRGSWKSPLLFVASGLKHF